MVITAPNGATSSNRTQRLATARSSRRCVNAAAGTGGVATSPAIGPRVCPSPRISTGCSIYGGISTSAGTGHSRGDRSVWSSLTPLALTAPVSHLTAGRPSASRATRATWSSQALKGRCFRGTTGVGTATFPSRCHATTGVSSTGFPLFFAKICPAPGTGELNGFGDPYFDLRKHGRGAISTWSSTRTTFMVSERDGPEAAPHAGTSRASDASSAAPASH